MLKDQLRSLWRDSFLVSVESVDALVLVLVCQHQHLFVLNPMYNSAGSLHNTVDKSFCAMILTKVIIIIPPCHMSKKNSDYV